LNEKLQLIFGEGKTSENIFLFVLERNLVWLYRN